MKTIAELAGASSSGNIRWEPLLLKVVEGYLESNSIFRQFCKIFPLENTYTANIPRSFSTGEAVEIVEGMEIPAVRQVLSTVDVKVTANGTAFEISDEAKRLNFYGDLVASELEEAMKRMLRKENQDIVNTLAGASGTVTADVEEDGLLQFSDIVDLRVKMEGNPYWAQPNLMLISPERYADLVKDDMFVDFSQSNTLSPLREGTVGGNIAGINVVPIPEIQGFGYMMDMSQNPLWLVVLQDVVAEAFRLHDNRTEKVQITSYQKPAVLKPHAIGKLDMKEE